MKEADSLFSSLRGMILSHIQTKEVDVSNETPKPPSIAPGRVLITVRDAMTILSMGKTKIYDLVAKGEIVLLRAPHMSRLVVQSIDDYLQRLLNSPNGGGPTTA